TGARLAFDALGNRAGKPAGDRPAADGSLEVGPHLHPHALEQPHIAVEGMGGEIEADRAVLAREPLLRIPRLGGRQLEGCGRPAEQLALAELTRLAGARGGGQDAVDGGEDAGPVRLEAVEGPGGGEAFERAPADRARIDAPREVAEIGEGA